MERVTTTIDSETLREIRRVAGKRGVSRFLQDAARERLARIRTLGLLDDLDARYGAPSTELKVEVDAEMRKIFRVAPSRGRR
jgi:hypothetical protein